MGDELGTQGLDFEQDYSVVAAIDSGFMESIAEAFNMVSLIKASVMTSICHPLAMVLPDFF